MKHLFHVGYAGRWPTLGMISIVVAFLAFVIWAYARQARRRGEHLNIPALLGPAAVPILIVAGLLWSVWQHWPA